MYQLLEILNSRDFFTTKYFFSLNITARYKTYFPIRYVYFLVQKEKNCNEINKINI